MEKELDQIKKRMHESELSGFVFTDQMKRSVLLKAQGAEPKRKPVAWIPAILSVAFVVFFFTGIYQLVVNDSQNAAPEKSELIYPTYIPDDYVYKHARVSGELYEHVYVHQTNENEYFSYRMQKAHPEIYDGEPTNIPLTPTILATVYEVSQTHTILIWEDEGYYQVVEQEGSLPESDFLKIVHSILVEKGYESYLSES